MSNNIPRSPALTRGTINPWQGYESNDHSGELIEQHQKEVELSRPSEDITLSDDRGLDRGPKV